MYREAIEELKQWKDSKRRKPLMITGVRQCGKTYLIKEFAKECFRDYVYLNFEAEEKLADIFAYDYDVERILKEIEQVTQQKIVPGKFLCAIWE